MRDIFTVRLEKNLRNKLKHLATESQRSMAAQIRWFIANAQFDGRQEALMESKSKETCHEQKNNNILQKNIDMENDDVNKNEVKK